MTHFRLSKRQSDILRILVDVKRQGFKKVSVHDLAENAGTERLVCYSNLKDMRKKGFVRCDGDIKPDSEWSITNKGCELIAMETATPDKPGRTEIVHERQHLGITTTKDRLTIVGDSAPASVTTDSGTTVGLKARENGLSITSDDKRKIEFKKE